MINYKITKSGDEVARFISTVEEIYTLKLNFGNWVEMSDLYSK